MGQENVGYARREREACLRKNLRTYFIEQNEVHKPSEVMRVVRVLMICLVALGATVWAGTEVQNQNANLEVSVLEEQIRQLEFELDGGLNGHAPDPVTILNLKEQLSLLYAQRVGRVEHNPLDQGSETCPGTPLSGLPIVVTGTTIGYAHNHSPYTPCGGTAAPDVVYSFVAPHSLTYTFSTEGSSYDTYLYIIGVGPCPGTTQVGCDDDGGPGTTSLITVALTAGTSYYIYVDGYNTSEGNYVLTIRDNCAVLPQNGDALECIEVSAPGHELNDCNGGCINPSGSQTWQDMFLYQPVYGRLFTFIGSDNLEWRDTDVYRFTLTEPCSLRISLQSEITTRMYILTDNCPWNIVYDASVWQYPCSTKVVTTPCLQPGTYNLWIAPNVFTGINDYRDYRVLLEPIPCAGCRIDSSVVAPGMVNGLTCEDEISCNRTNNESNVIAVVIPYESDWTLTLCGNSGPWDSYLALSETCCGLPIVIADDNCGGLGLTAEISCQHLTAGTFYVSVSGYAPYGCGYYELTVSECIGSCCYGDPSAPSCAQTNFLDCQALGGAFTVQEPCSVGACPPRPTCDGEALMSQYPALPDESWSQVLSVGPVGTCDNYDVSGPIGSIRFWGFPESCVESPTNFQITFDNGINQQVYNVSTVGTVLAQYNYQDIYGMELHQYSVTLSPPCTLLTGNVSVTMPGDGSCWWLWLSSNFGDNIEPCSLYDLAFCLGAAPPPCDPVDSLTINWEYGDSYGFNWWQPQAGTVTLWVTTDPNAVYPAGYALLGTLYSPAGRQYGSILSPETYLNAVLTLDCGGSPVASQPGDESAVRRFRLIE